MHVLFVHCCKEYHPSKSHLDCAFRISAIYRIFSFLCFREWKHSLFRQKLLTSQLSVQSNPELFGFTLLRSLIGLNSRATYSATNQIQLKTNRNLVFPRLMPITCIWFVIFSFVNCSRNSIENSATDRQHSAVKYCSVVNGTGTPKSITWPFRQRDTFLY